MEKKNIDRSGTEGVSWKFQQDECNVWWFISVGRNGQSRQPTGRCCSYVLKRLIMLLSPDIQEKQLTYIIVGKYSRLSFGSFVQLLMFVLKLLERDEDWLPVLARMMKCCGVCQDRRQTHEDHVVQHDRWEHLAPYGFHRPGLNDALVEFTGHSGWLYAGFGQSFTGGAHW